jgi:microsomal dipeptidase-like Zn-dependent dipeptidase
VRTTVWVAAVALVVLAACAATAAADAPTRYSLAGGCYDLQNAAGQTVPGAERLRMQATRLGSYLLYTPARAFLSAGEDGSVAPAAQPSPAGDWQVDSAGGNAFTLTPASATGRQLAFTGGRLALAGAGSDGTKLTFAAANGCADYPEASLNATGTPSKGDEPFGAVHGFIDGHMHWMTFEYLGGNFHCGRPWSPYGIPYALPDCSSIEGPNGSAAPVQNTLNFGQPASPHDTAGWPKLTAWNRNNVTYEGIYWRWMQRAWMGGLKLIVMPVNENRVLCELMTNRRNSCDEMTTVRKGIQDMHDLQDYVDAQMGGPGKGFFQVVTDPFEARKVMNEGKMAVVLEIEVSELFGCKGWDHPTCDQAQVDRELDEFYDLGVRSSLFLNKFDNPLAGVRFDSGAIGALINGGNKLSADSFWDAETCKGQEADNPIQGGAPADPNVTGLLGTLGVAGGSIPTYPPAPNCNTRGLTDLGAHLANRMIDKHMILNPDHMSQKAVDATISIAEQRHYSGIISPHGWMDPRNWPRIWALGGMAFPNAGASTHYVDAWKQYAGMDKSTGTYPLGWGWGADLGGLAQQGAPGPAGDTSVTYPFKSYDGKVTFDRQQTGDRVFDYSKEGVAHYGLYPDWVNEVGKLGGPGILSAMWNSSEAYLDMWERANGVPGPGCKDVAALGRKGMGGLKLGATPEATLFAEGQPEDRTRTWSYCVNGAGNGSRAAAAIFSPEGRIGLVGTNARGAKAAGLAPGSKLRGAKHGLKVKRVRGTNYVFGVRHNRVKQVAVAAGFVARDKRKLREYLKLLQGAKAHPLTATPARVAKSRVPVATASPLVASSVQQAGDGVHYLCFL